MRLFVIGATGGTGRALVEQAAGRGHQVTAFVRSPQKLGAPAAGVTVVAGDPRQATELGAAMPGCDAVISALGPPMPFTGKTTILGDGARATVEAMAAAGVRRLLVVSGDLQFADAGRMVALIRATLMRHLARDQADMERVVMASDLEWTVARPTRLTHAAASGAYRVAPDHLPRAARAISRADVASFLHAAAERGEHLHSVVGLAG